MMTISEHTDDARRTRGTDGRWVAMLWFGLLAAPAAFLIDLVVSFAMVGWSCGSDQRVVPWLVTAAAAAVAAAGAWRAWVSWRIIGRDAHPRGEGVEKSSPHSSGHTLANELRTDAPDAEGRSRFMALAGIAGSLFFLFLILASVVPALLLAPCS